MRKFTEALALHLAGCSAHSRLWSGGWGSCCYHCHHDPRARKSWEGAPGRWNSTSKALEVQCDMAHVANLGTTQRATKAPQNLQKSLEYPWIQSPQRGGKRLVSPGTREAPRKSHSVKQGQQSRKFLPHPPTFHRSASQAPSSK